MSDTFAPFCVIRLEGGAAYRRHAPCTGRSKAKPRRACTSGHPTGRGRLCREMSGDCADRIAKGASLIWTAYYEQENERCTHILKFLENLMQPTD